MDNIIMGRNKPIDVADFLEAFKLGRTYVLDVRGNPESKPLVERFGERWVNIPQDQLASRVLELSKEKPVCLICDTGPRSYEAQCLLASHGITETRNIQGGFGMLKKSAPEFQAA